MEEGREWGMEMEKENRSSRDSIDCLSVFIWMYRGFCVSKPFDLKCWQQNIHGRHQQVDLSHNFKFFQESCWVFSSWIRGMEIKEGMADVDIYWVNTKKISDQSSSWSLSYHMIKQLAYIYSPLADSKGLKRTENWNSFPRTFTVNINGYVFENWWLCHYDPRKWLIC